MRSAAWIAVLAAAALGCGAVVTVVTDGAGWPWFAAPAAIVALAGAFGWLRRGSDAGPAFGSAFVLSYAAIVGLALVRLAEFDPAEATAIIFPYTARWPAIAFGAIPFALMCTVFVAMPMKLLPHRRRRTTPAGERFWAFLAERDAERASPKTLPGPG